MTELRAKANKNPPVIAEYSMMTVPTAAGCAPAPILYFDEVPAIGSGPAGIRVALTAQIQDVAADGSITYRKVAVAHLRGSASAFRNLQEALAQINNVPGSRAGHSRRA